MSARYTASYLPTAGGVQTYSYTATGGISIAGAAAQTRGRAVTPAGGISFSGAASMLRGVVRTITGGITLSGAAAVVRGCTKAVSGGISFAGAAGVIFNDVVAAVGNWKRGLQSRRNRRNNGTYTKRR